MGLLPASYGTNTPAMIHRRNSLATLGVEKRIFHGPTRRRCCMCPQMHKLARCTVSGMHHQSDTTYQPGKGHHARAIQAERLGPSSLKHCMQQSMSLLKLDSKHVARRRDWTGAQSHSHTEVAHVGTGLGHSRTRKLCHALLARLQSPLDSNSSPLDSRVPPPQDS